MSSQVKIASSKRGRWVWPIAGLILALAAGGIGYALAPNVEDLIRDLFPAFRRSGMSAQTFRWVLTVITGAVFLLVAVMLVSIGSRRKNPLDVNNATLVKERNEMIAEHKAMKKRQRQMNQKMRDYVRENQKKS